MALNTKAIKRRIKSIGNTKKITKAMEMISAVKMRKAVHNVLATRSYATAAWNVLQDIAKTTNVSAHPLLKRRKVKKTGMILITSNRGLAGGFASRLLQEAHRHIETSKSETDVEADIILSGRRGQKMYHKFGHTVVAEFEKIDLTTRVEEILPIAQLAIQEYLNGTYDRIVVAYTDFVSAISQVPRVKQILPLTDPDAFLGVAELAQESAPKEKNPLINIDEPLYLFEPTAKGVLDRLLPRLIEMQIYQSVLESDASEHSARMLAMKNASDAASDMIKELQYSFNKARQAAITQEISEIVGGAAALE